MGSLTSQKVAESLDHSTILIGECKWTTGENGRLLTNGINKIVPFLPFVIGKKSLSNCLPKYFQRKTKVTPFCRRTSFAYFEIKMLPEVGYYYDATDLTDEITPATDMVKTLLPQPAPCRARVG